MIGNRTIAVVLWVVVVLIGELHQRAWAEKPGTPAVSDPAAAGHMARDFIRVSNAIDYELDKRLAEASVPASPCADDAEFLRRVTIDIVGRIPTRQEATAFLASTDGDKRRKRIDDLLASQQYGQHFQDIWRGLIEPRTDSGSRSPKDQFGPWLAAQFNRNRGWNEIVYAMLAAEGDLSQVPETGFIMAQSANSQPQPNQLATATMRLFLGVRLQCAECHNHPFGSWQQNDFWAIAAFFSRVRNSNPKSGKFPSLLIESPADRGMTSEGMIRTAPGGAIVIPTSAGKAAGRIVKPRFLGGEDLALGDEGLYRIQFAKWVTSPDNKFFSQAAVNRLWAHFFARGLFMPVDDFPVDDKKPSSHPKLLELLTREFAASGFDQKHMIRAICNSQAYQRTSRPLAANEADKELFSRMAVKTFSPEVLHDSLVDLTNVSQLKPADPGRKGSSRDPRMIFCNLFRPQGEPDPIELNYGIPQFLRRMNAEYLNNGSPLLNRLASSRMSREQMIEAIYLATVTRPPTANEMRLMSDYVAKRSSSDEGYAGVLWILLNSGEFVLNH